MMRDLFNAHLDACKQCREHPFALCSVGSTLLQQAVMDYDEHKSPPKRPVEVKETR